MKRSFGLWESQLQIYFLCEKCLSQFQVLEFFRDIWKDISELFIKRNRTSPAMNVANHLVNHIICVAFLELKKIVFSKKNSKIYILRPFSIQFLMLISNMYLVFFYHAQNHKVLFCIGSFFWSSNLLGSFFWSSNFLGSFLWSSNLVSGHWKCYF